MLQTFLLTFALTAALSVGRIGPIPGTVDVTALYDRSPVVCRGVVVDGTAAPEPASGPLRVRGTVLIKRAYKGELTHGQPVTVEFTQHGMYGPALESGDHVLLFLEKSGNDGGTYTVVDQKYGIFSNLARLEVLSESHKGISALAKDIALGLAARDKGQVLSSLEILQGLYPVPAPAQASLERTAGSQDPVIRLMALSALVSNESPQSVFRLATAFRNDPQLATHGGRGVFSAAAHLRRISNPESLEALHELANSANSAIRYSALDAIRAVASGRSVRFLISALDDHDANVRVQAAATLSEIIGKGDDFFPGAAAFLENDRPYVARWKKWWSEEGRRTY